MYDNNDPSVNKLIQLRTETVRPVSEYVVLSDMISNCNDNLLFAGILHMYVSYKHQLNNKTQTCRRLKDEAFIVQRM